MRQQQQRANMQIKALHAECKSESRKRKFAEDQVSDLIEQYARTNDPGTADPLMV